jgi:hypothetical protein
MRVIQLQSLAPAVAALLLLAGCNGSIDGSDGSSGGSTANASAVGIWSGNDSISGLAVTAIINSLGQAAFLRADGAQFVGGAQLSGSNIAVAIDGFSNFGTTFADGATTGVGTLSGTVVSGSSLTASLSFTTSDGTSISGDWTLSFDALSNVGSSLSTISGNYTDGSSGATVSIDGLGNLNSQDASTNCVLNGTVSTSDTGFDIYQISYSYKNCTGNDAALNDIQFSGMAVLNTNLSPRQLVIAATGRGSNGDYGIISYLNAT